MTDALAPNAPKRVPIPKNGVDYRGKIVLAPMVRSGELPSRLLALKYGADLVWGPETIDKALIGTTRRINTIANTIEWTRYPSSYLRDVENGVTPSPDVNASVIYRLHPEKERGKLIFQIGTAKPEHAVEAARLVAADVAGIDVNAGCPKPFSTTGGMGAALLQTPDRLVSILEALVREVGREFEIGISVKIRLLETPEKTESLVRRLVGTGITGLTVHCRTTPMRPRERAIREQLKMIVGVCEEAGVACLMNGDVTGKDEAIQLMQEYGADGAMIATAAEKNSSCFRSQADGGLVGWEQIVREYVELCLEVENRWGNTKYLLGQLIPGKEGCYRPMNQSKGYEDMVKALRFDDLIEKARHVDQRLNIKPAESKAVKKAKRKEALAGKGEGKGKDENMDAKRVKMGVEPQQPLRHILEGVQEVPGAVQLSV
ncbi:putative tRNA dihydrouridine synthase [Patellaria atrata CBS 101060]|uniref:tRNA dihydrouridine synthase n=1 Tax=Patellaria atrata CBS 101060 TaxID=1346257 RepID=A0A9P4VMB1_9PEZI|nr:putative tRNA dihydrouridine synthase [Patellaria atrata CBS 101060]